MTAALAWIVAGVFLSGLCLGGLAGALFGAIVAKLPSAHVEGATVEQQRPAPAPTDRRAGHHIRWEHDRQEARRELEETLAAGNDRLVRNGLLADLPSWASSQTQPYRHVNGEVQ